jgi:hypothetical protein
MELTKEQEQQSQSFMETAMESETGNPMVEATARFVVKLDEVDDALAMELLDIVADITASAIAYGKELSEGDDINAFVQELIDNGVPLGAMVEEIN